MDVRNSLIRSLGISKYLTQSRWLRINEVQLYFVRYLFMRRLVKSWPILEWWSLSPLTLTLRTESPWGPHSMVAMVFCQWPHVRLTLVSRTKWRPFLKSVITTSRLKLRCHWVVWGTGLWWRRWVVLEVGPCWSEHWCPLLATMMEVWRTLIPCRVILEISNIITWYQH